MFFNGWESLGRTFVAGVVAYVSLIVLLRLAGKRTLAKLNAFDLVVTVALGSTLAMVVLSRDIALLEGVTAMALLVLLSSWSPRSRSARRRLAAFFADLPQDGNATPA